MGYFSYDHHAGGVASVLIGVVFLLIGAAICRMSSSSDSPGPPTGRRLAGALILSTGLVVLVVGTVLALLPGTLYTEALLPVMPVSLAVDDRYVLRLDQMVLPPGRFARPVGLPDTPRCVVLNGRTTIDVRWPAREPGKDDPPVTLVDAIAVEAPGGYVFVSAEHVPDGLLVLLQHRRDRHMELVRYLEDARHLRYIMRERFLVELTVPELDEPPMVLQVNELQDEETGQMVGLAAAVHKGEHQQRFVWRSL